jgi:tRNA (cytidine/uridine-2'-O-)-methyltransferase
MFAVVLVHPEIPPNTGNVIRLTANTGADLHLVEPLGFRMDDRELKRAGLDYHEHARVRVHRDLESCREALDVPAPRRWFAFATRATTSLYETRFEPGDVLVFGCESTGLSAAALAGFAPRRTLRIPMRPGVRSLNLSNAVAVAVYEAWRQQGFAGSG